MLLTNPSPLIHSSKNISFMHSIIHKLYILASAICFSIPAFTQQVPTVPYQSIPALSLEVSTRQTSVIIFPTAIKSIDRGNGNIITKTVKEIGNVLKVKAATDSFQCTNIMFLQQMEISIPLK